MEATDHRQVTSGEDRSADIDRLNAELRREHEMYLRALADFDNYRRRVERERASADRAGKRDVILSMLEVLDSFEAALAHLQQAPSSVAAGMEAVYRKLLGSLEKHGVTPFTSVGKEFDPLFHEAIGSVASGEHMPGIVVEELQRGFKLGDELLRPARVRVSQ
jgi:molecular chaperone GrpE